MKSKITILSYLLSLIALQNTICSDLINISPITNKIIMLHYDDGHIDYAGYHEYPIRDFNKIYSHPLDTVGAVLPVNYNLSSKEDVNYNSPQNPVTIGRKSKGTDFHSQWPGAAGFTGEFIREHNIYIEFPNALERGKTYTLHLNGLADNCDSIVFLYNEAELFSEAIHISQVGFVTNSVKYAYLSQWMGDFDNGTMTNGGLELDDLTGNNFYIVPDSNRSIAAAKFSGVIEKRKDKLTSESTSDDFGSTKNYSYSDVWECDFSTFNEPGVYVVVVEDMGCSYPFAIGDDVYRQAYYAASRGMFYQRTGIAKEIKPGLVIPRAHHPDDLRHYYNADKDGKSHQNLGNPANYPTVYDIWGYYHDAGDWDRYEHHDVIPPTMLLLYDLKSGNFGDGDVANRYKLHIDSVDFIEEGGNGIPDLLDEARWLIEWGKRGRHALMSDKNNNIGTGGVPGSYTGREGANDALPSWEDDRDWCVSREDPTTTLYYVGSAAWYAYLLKEMGKPLADYQPWIDEVLDTYTWAVNKGGGSNDVWAYAAVSLYRVTEDNQYQTTFKSKYTAGGIDISRPSPWQFSAAIYAMIPSDFPDLDIAKQSQIKNHLKNTADNAVSPIEDGENKRGYRLGMPEGRAFSLGSHNTPRIISMAMAYEVTGDQKYLDACHTTAAYCMGGNETNMSFLTQVGFNPEKFVFHKDSWLLPELNYNSKVYTNPILEGFVSYGGNVDGWVKGDGDELWSQSSLYPNGFENWPKGEGRIQNRNSIAGSEFTVHQSNVQALFAYGYLCGTSNGSLAKNERPTIVITYPSDNQQFAAGSDVQLTVDVSDDVREVKYYYEEHFIGTTTAKPFNFVWQNAPSGTYEITAVAYDNFGLISEPTEGGDVVIELGAFPAVGVTGVSFINCPSEEIDVNSTYQFIPVFEPIDATNRDLVWSTSNPEVFSVNTQGKVFAKDHGSAIITAISEDGNFEAVCTLYVTPPVDVTAVNFTSCNSTTVGTEGTITIEYEIIPENATNKSVTWESSNESIAVVDENGIIDGVAPGNANITIQTVDGAYTDVCNVTVVESNLAPVMNPVKDTTILKNSGPYVIDITGIHDGNGGGQQISFLVASDRENVVPNPVISYTEGETTATLTFQPVADVTGIANITVTISDDGGTLYNGVDSDTYTFEIRVVNSLSLVIPGVIQAEDFSSVDGEVQTGDAMDVDGTEYVGWFGQGEKLIYDVTEVEKSVYDVSFRVANGMGNSTSGSIKLWSGSTLLTDIEVPVTGGWVTWQTISDMIYLGDGAQTITLEQGGPASFNINWIDFVKNDIPCCPESVSISNCLSDSIPVNATYNFTSSIAPSDAFLSMVSWNSSDPAVASIDQNGHLIAKSEGTTTVTVTTGEGNFSDECQVKVYLFTGIKSHGQSTPALVFPNPVNTDLQVQSHAFIDKIVITDLSGKNLISYEDVNSKEYSINVRNLYPGIYLIKLTYTDKSIGVEQFVKK